MLIAYTVTGCQIYDRKSVANITSNGAKLFFFKIGIFSACETFREHNFFGYELVDIRSILVVFLKVVGKGITTEYDLQNMYDRFDDLQE